ncbi:pre-rRNA-processing protein TSR1 homolog isoform X2 [Saccostrea echinata]|uniref:pre-rRNA-processing protein TSR1 homolog isoform X1 n=1 Tax=Saccostrea echinata TaxID=191078 RepID=UPI002A816965|nr:pre-rRNA-processing protein TSR1 homolog isoform X1 [Saccostrea echinata]XP_061187466.1 pre-rRNA-processing protein TSR1 homolog isoform X2 [Saccostrea echinata]
MAADVQQQAHRPGALKQQNKTHKHGKHKSKGQLDKETKGRVNVKTSTKKNKAQQRKQDRKHHVAQVRKQKREEILSQKRSRGGNLSPPYFVVVLSLHEGLDVSSVLEVLKSCDESAVVTQNEQGVIHVSVPRFKQRISFYVPEFANLYAVMDSVKVADSLLCVLSPEGGIDEYGEQVLKCLFAQGIPSVTFVTQGLKKMGGKKQSEARKFLQKKIEKWFPHEKLHNLDSEQDGLLIMRNVANQKIKAVHYRDNRPHLIAEEIQFELDNEEAPTGTLKVTGFLRGRSLSANSLVHIVGWGDFQMTQIDARNDPYPLNPKADRQKEETMEEDTEDARVLERAIPGRQESLQSENVPGEMEGEQTWPTEEEMAEAEAALKAKTKLVKRVPKGTSEYQASWIVDSEEEEIEDDESDDEDEEIEEEDIMAVDASGSESEEEVEYDTLTVTEAGDVAYYDQTIDMDEEERILEKIKEERSHVMFPDEIDTPREKDARDRFQRYRGLKSFRTSPWDPKENLPSDYARIFQFKDFKRTKKRILKNLEDEGVLSGWYIQIHISNVPKDFITSYKPGTPVVIFGLLPHEHKMSVLNFLLKRVPDYRPPIKSKDRLIFHVGFRRYSACPIFSQHTNANKHKFERFFAHDTVTMATIFAPISFPPCPVLVFKEQHDGQHELVATGSLHSVDPDRIITKRIVLSGHPFKINKRSAVVRYMFFNREDIEWFKPVELRTKWGRRGHIREPLGTHGHMKCVFDGHLKSQDTVLMNLYKRMFPKWSYNPTVLNPPPMLESSNAMTTEPSGYQLFDD